MEQPGPSPEDMRFDPRDAGPYSDLESARPYAEFVDDTLGTGSERLPLAPDDKTRAQRQRDIDVATKAAEFVIPNADILAGAPGIARAVAARVSPESEAERRDAVRAAQIDSLTGVASKEALDRALHEADKDPHTMVIYFDGDNFKAINDTINHSAGDAALIAMAQAVRQAAAEFGTNRVFRDGGDEFVVLAADDPDACQKIIDRTGELLQERVNDPADFQDQHGKKYASEQFRELGLSITGHFAKTKDEADQLMRGAKALKKNR